MTKLATIKAAMAALGQENFQETDYQARGYHLEVRVAPDEVVRAVRILDQQQFFLEAVTGVDWLGEKAALLKEKEKARAAAKKAAEKAAKAAEEAGEPPPAVEPPVEEEEPGPEDLADEMEVVYDFNSTEELCRVVVRTRVPREKPELPTISSIFPGANWHERETHDFFGIIFTGHPDLSPLLLPEDADFHPLLKDFHV